MYNKYINYDKDKMDRQYGSYKLLGLLFSALLIGCGGDSSSSLNTNSSIPPSGSFIAYNGLVISQPNEQVNVDLNNYVEGGADIVSITADNPDCNSPQTNGMKFSVSLENASFCTYDYQVKNQTNQTAKATIGVFATDSETPTDPARTLY